MRVKKKDVESIQSFSLKTKGNRRPMKTKDVDGSIALIVTGRVTSLAVDRVHWRTLMNTAMKSSCASQEYTNF